MSPKVAAAIITGTMARPSSPSVRLTALPAPAITRTPSSTNTPPSGSTTFLKNGTVSDEEKPALPTRITAQAAMPATAISASRRSLPETPPTVLLVTFR